MKNAAYTYCPDKIAENGKDRMRFELGDVMVEGGPDTTALSDAEIEAALSIYPDRWKCAKLMLLETLYHRFSYEVDVKTGPTQLNLSDRAKIWCEEYLSLKQELKHLHVPAYRMPSEKVDDGNYFHLGMMRNPKAGGGKCSGT